MEARIVGLTRVLAQLEQDVDFITKYIHIVQEDTLHIPPMTAQSADVVSEQVETVIFHDTEVGDTAGLATSDVAFIEDDFIDEASLAQFLSRPVRIATTTWLESDAATTTKFTINPWQLFFSDPRIKRKIDNFAFLRANLKLKVLVNASPFYHGYALVAYQPLPNFTPSTLTTDAALARIQVSQRPHLWINPQDNQAGEMTLPFFWPENWISVKQNADFSQMGTLQMRAFTSLASANGTVGSGVSVQVFAWAEDVKLSGSTLSLSMQSKDEYGTGPISAPASALANVAAALEPKFGRFATATRMIASTTAGVAKLFGYSNVPVLEEAKPMRVSQFANFASTELGFPLNKLTLDAKNELSVDPTVLGMPNEDEMSISHIVQKESFYYSFSWSTADVVDTTLAYQNITPMCVDTLSTTGQTAYVYTPMAYVAGLFNAWRGDIRLTFRFASTQYHKGRLRITYDPQGDATNNVLSVNDGNSGAYTVFADISDSTEVSMVIPFQQALPYLTTSATSLPGKCYATSGFVFNMDAALHNGAIAVKVATVLSAPVASSVVPVLVFVQGCENLEFQNPARIDPRLSPFVVQSADEVLGTSQAAKDVRRGLVNYGETVRSLRQLARRTTPTMPMVFPVNNALVGLRRYRWAHRKIPPYPGFDPNSIYTGVKKVGAGNAPYTWAAMSPLQYVVLPFVAYRGSTFWHYAPHCGGAATSSSIQPLLRSVRRPEGLDFGVDSGVQTLSATSTSSVALSVLQEYGQSGMIITNPYIGAGTAVAVPNQVRYLFQSTDPRNPTLPSTQIVDDSDKDCVENVLDLPTGNAADRTTSQTYWIDAYCGAGTDFSCHFFLNTPTLYGCTTVIPV